MVFRWVSVQIDDLARIGDSHPDLAQEFQNGLFTARVTNRPFSAMALDQAHEQMNAIIKSDGGKSSYVYSIFRLIS